MRRLTRPTRRHFGQGLGFSLVLAALPRSLPAHQGAHEVVVRIEDFAFAPVEIDIDAGDSVTWINGDVAPHTATARDGSWETGPIERNDQVRITFNASGTHLYLCDFHPQMQGTIVVHPKADG